MAFENVLPLPSWDKYCTTVPKNVAEMHVLGTRHVLKRGCELAINVCINNLSDTFSVLRQSKINKSEMNQGKINCFITGICLYVCTHNNFSTPTPLLMVHMETPQAVWYQLALSWFTVVFGSGGEVCKKTKHRLRQTTSLLVARHGDVSCKLNHALLLVDSFSTNVYC